MDHSMTTLEWDNWSILAGCACGHIVIYRPIRRIFSEDFEKHMPKVTALVQAHFDHEAYAVERTINQPSEEA